jgi:hypothetical protein
VAPRVPFAACLRDGRPRGGRTVPYASWPTYHRDTGCDEAQRGRRLGRMDLHACKLDVALDAYDDTSSTTATAVFEGGKAIVENQGDCSSIKFDPAKGLITIHPGRGKGGILRSHSSRRVRGLCRFSGCSG